MHVTRSYSGLLLAVGVLVAGSARPAAAQEIIDREYDLKAVYVYNFGKYVEWPKDPFPDAADHFVIGVLGKDPFPKQLNQIAGRTIGEKPILIRRFKTMEEYTPCHILFISAASATEGKESAEDRLKAAVETTQGKPVLLVSENAGFARKGSIINFVVDAQENRISLEANPDAAKRAELKIGSRLLALEKSGLLKILRDGK